MGAIFFRFWKLMALSKTAAHPTNEREASFALLAADGG
jgi:hypothetical protein